MNSTINISTSLPSVYRFTPEEWLFYTLFYFIFGIVASIGNFLIFYLIVKDKKLHTFFYALIAGHTLGRAIYSLEYVILAVYHAVANFTWKTIAVSRLSCHTLHVLAVFCNSFSSITLLLLAIDRAYSLIKPTSYRNRSAKQGTYIVIAVAAFILIAKVLPSYAGSTSFSTVIVCNSGQDPVTVDFWKYNYYTNFFLALATITLYFILFLFALVRKRSLATGSWFQEESNRVLKHQLILLDSIRFLIIFNVLTVIPFNVLQLTSSGYFDPYIRTQIIHYGACFSSIDRVLDPWILIWKSSDLRKSFINTFSKTRNTVAQLDN